MAQFISVFLSVMLSAAHRLIHTIQRLIAAIARHRCSHVIVYTYISQGDRVFEDAAGFDSLHGHGLLFRIQNRYKSFAYSLWRDES